ncbi:MAG: phosphatase PAP2 family protein [Candidatus Cloacimonadaceae bacterium]|nr:phosphatase PAP2 family protein [Candidatus Cloacimonadaceae bacterium]MDP3115363.1 phosphatase PAP2 family protein [Candidatus Cloacimonadaceae bacterium]
MTERFLKTNSPCFSAIDKITIAFCGWFVLYMLIGLSRATDVYLHLPAYLSILALVFLMAWAQQNLDPVTKPRMHSALSFVRSIYPVLLFGYFFTSSYAVNRVIFADWLDPLFHKIDHQLFGYYPSMVWGQRFSHWAVSELFHFAYFCYYLMIAGLPVYLYFKKKAAFKELIFNLTFVFYLCYWIYSFLPVVGGRFFPEAMEMTKHYRAGVFTHIMVFIYSNTVHLGGAFPSSHVGITVVLTIAALKFVRPLGYIFAVITFFLTLATVYCHYHWFIDAVAGVGIGILGYYLALFVHRKIQGETP